MDTTNVATDGHVQVIFVVYESWSETMSLNVHVGKR